MNDITDLGGPLIDRATQALTHVGIGVFMPAMVKGQDMVAIMIGDAHEVPDLRKSVLKALKRAGLRDVQFGPVDKAQGNLTMYVAWFPISANTVTRIEVTP